MIPVSALCRGGDYLFMNKKYFFYSIIIIILAGVLSYSNCFKNDFVWDDYNLIVKNELIRNVHNYDKVLIQELLDKSRTNYYRPIQVFSYMLDYHIAGFSPFGYHIHNLLLHLLNAILVYILAGCFFRAALDKSDTIEVQIKASRIALFSSLFFVVHPVHVQSVAYISSRADLLAGFFMLSTLLLYIRHFKAEGIRRILYLSSIFLFCMALFSKEMSIVFPVILISYEYFFIREKNVSCFLSRINRLAPFLLIACSYVIMRLTILDFSLAPIWLKGGVYSPNIAIRIFSFLKGIVLYLTLLVMPVNLHAERIITPAVSIFNFYVLIFIFLLIVLVIVFKKFSIRNKRFILFGLIWFIVFLFPQSTFVFIWFLAEHYLYLPSIGMFLIAGYGVNSLWARKRNLARLIAVAIVIFWGLLTFSQNYVWRDSFTFYRWTDKYSDKGFLTRNNLANIYLYLGLDDMAFKKYKQALVANPYNETIRENISMVRNNLIEEYKNIERSRPGSSVNYYNLGYLYEIGGSLNEAISYYKKAIAINPNFVEAISNLGNVYEKTGDYDQALLKYRQAISLDPQFAKGYFNIGVVLANQGRLKEAKDWFSQALKIDPDYQKAEENIKKISQNLKYR